MVLRPSFLSAVRRSLRLWPFVIVALLVSAAMVVVAERARVQADHSFQAQSLVEHIRAESSELHALQAQAIVELLQRDRTVREVLGELAPKGLAIYADLDRSVARLRVLEPGEHTDHIAETVGRLEAETQQVLTAAASAGVSEALAIELRTVEPELANLDAQLREDVIHHAADAARASRRAQIALLASMIGGMLMLALLTLGFERIRRRSAVAAQMRDVERRSEERTRALMEHSSDVVTVVDAELCVVWQAASAQRMLGGSPDALVGHSLLELVHPDDQPRMERALARCQASTGTQTVAVRLRHADGTWVQVESIAESRLGDPTVGGILLSMRDVGERRALEEQLRHQAYHDPLTGLANRTLFEQRLKVALADAGEHGTVAVLYLDLDDFKTINDSLGHAVGDELLRVVARRITSVLRAGDLASRQGGDEFAVLLPDVDDERAALAVGERIVAALAPDLEIDGRMLSAQGSLGLVLSERGDVAEELLRNADIAMYSAKTHAKGAIRIYEPELHRIAVDRLELGAELATAVEGGQFFLDFQPIVELDSGKVTGVEALVRWQHPTRGLLPPAQFIALAEETGAIVALGRWVLRTACTDIQRLRETEAACGDLELSVNVSIKQLQEPSFPDEVAAALADAGLPASALVLELTESVLIEDPDQTMLALERLKALGVRLAVDDFGTGHSVLSYLQDFPIDVLKIDKSFVDTVHTSTEQAKLVAGIVQLSESLHLEVVAEGIEEAEQVDQLRAMHSRLGQGYLFSRPVPVHAIAELMAPRAVTGA